MLKGVPVGLSQKRALKFNQADSNESSFPRAGASPPLHETNPVHKQCGAVLIGSTRTSITYEYFLLVYYEHI